MAPFFSPKTLKCFYCSNKSGIKYDGSITQWDCSHCQVTNYLDESGDITDPPVATDYAATGKSQYLIRQIPQYDAPFSKSSASIPFCSTCLKNQHLYTAGLAQIHVEVDEDHPNYDYYHKQYLNSKEELLKIYPQVCDECTPAARERVEASAKMAKTDWLGWMMEYSRERRAGRESEISILGTFVLIGQLLYYFGLLGQITWNIATLYVHMQPNLPAVFSFPLPDLVSRLSFGLSELSISAIPFHYCINWISLDASTFPKSVTKWILWASLVSLWWNPKYKECHRGFMNHLKGVDYWYKLTCTSFCVRLCFYYLMRKVLIHPSSKPAAGAHIVMLAITLYMANEARCSIKVDMSPIWTIPVNRIPSLVPISRSGSPNDVVGDLLGALDQISRSSSQTRRNSSSLSASNAMAFNSNRDELYSSSYASGSQSALDRLPPKLRTPLQKGSTSSLAEMSLNESEHYPKTREVPTRLHRQLSDSHGEDMDWTPSQSQEIRSQHRAFNQNPAHLAQRKIQLFSESPTAPEPSAFWYKVPPAPSTPAQRLRNPPNAPSFRSSSKEVKENFFKMTTEKNSTFGRSDESLPSGQDRSRRGIEFAQQKFFPPAQSDAGSNLADLFSNALSFKPDPEEMRKNSPEIEDFRYTHIIQGTVLIVALFLFNIGPWIPERSWDSTTLPALVIASCMFIASRNVPNSIFHPVLTPKHIALKSLLAGLAGVEFLAAIYGIWNIMEGSCHLYGGNVLIGFMMVQEFAVAKSID